MQVQACACAACVTDFRIVKELLVRVAPILWGLGSNKMPSSLHWGMRFAMNLHRIGGAKEDRTPDLLRARQALSQLSYGPGGVSGCLARSPSLAVPLPVAWWPWVCGGLAMVVGLRGFEPLTSPLSGVRSNQLSYRPVVFPAKTMCCGCSRPRRLHL